MKLQSTRLFIHENAFEDVFCQLSAILSGGCVNDAIWNMEPWSALVQAMVYCQRQLERLRSEDTPRPFMITHSIETCWIPSQNKVERPWRYRSRSKVITCNTPSHASDHLYQIWKESIRNCRCYRADTIFKAKAKWPWRYRSRSKVIICNTPSHTSDHLW